MSALPDQCKPGQAEICRQMQSALRRIDALRGALLRFWKYDEDAVIEALERDDEAYWSMLGRASPEAGAKP